MNSPVGSHEPTPAFRANLEWQIASSLRRETRFAEPVSGGRWSRFRAAAVLFAAFLVGGMVMAASGEVQEARQKDRLIEAARGEETLIRVRLELAKADYQDAQRRFEVGTAGRETLLAAERQMRAMERALARIQLDLQEIQATSAAPRNELDAPLVGKRDFVRERLSLRLDAAQHALVAAEQGLAEAQRKVEAGIASRVAQFHAESEVAQARVQMELVRAMLDLRQRALKKEIKFEALAAAVRRFELTAQNDQLQREIELAHRRIGELRRLVEVGSTSALELKRAEVELLEREIALQKVKRELESLGAVRRE